MSSSDGHSREREDKTFSPPPRSEVAGGETAAAAAVAAAVAGAAAAQTPRTAASTAEADGGQQPQQSAASRGRHGGGSLVARAENPVVAADDGGPSKAVAQETPGHDAQNSRSGHDAHNSNSLSVISEARVRKGSKPPADAAAADASSLAAHTEDERQFTISHLHRRQAEWDRQIEFHDQKQAELQNIQWKLVREQTGTLARELGIVQQQLKEMKVDSRRSLVEVERYFRETEVKMGEERSMRLALTDSMEQRFKKAKQDLDAEAKQRAMADAEVAPKLAALEESVTGRAREQRSLELEVAKLGKSVEAAMQEIDVLKEALDQEASERRSQDDLAMETLREVRDSVLKENRDRLALQEDHVRNHAAVVEQVRADHTQAHGLLKDKVAALQKELAPHREELPQLRSRLQEVESAINSRLKDSSKNFERELADRAALQQKMERRIVDLSAQAEKDHAARQSQAEDFEQHLKTFRTKLKGQMQEQAEAARLAREELQTSLLDQIEREAAMREAQAATLLDQWSGHKTAFDVRVDAMESNLRSLEQRRRDERNAETQDFEAAHQRQSEAFARQLRDQTEAFQAQFVHERALREQQHASTEEHMEFSDRFVQDIREVFLQKGTRARFRKSGVSNRGELASSQITPRERPPSPSSSCGRALGS